MQSIATLEILRRLGHDASIIDYIREDESGLNVTLTELNSKPKWSNNIIKKLLYILLRFPGEYLASKKFSKMRSKYLKLTDKRYKTSTELSTLKADIFMTGSDQVWGPIMNGRYDSAYFLSFVGAGAKKVSYASSFGRTVFTEDVLSNYHNLLSRYDEITVREDAAVDLISSMNIPCRGQVLDPTLLLTEKEWSKFIKKDITKKYVLVYQLHIHDEFNEYAKRFAQSVGLPLLRVSPSMHHFNRGGEFIYLPELGEFLSYIKNCQYLITDSFHGTVFALIFNKQLIEILPNNGTNSRNRSILKLTGLEDRIISDYNDFSIANRKIDYNKVNDIIDIERQKSIEAMQEMYKNNK